MIDASLEPGGDGVLTRCGDEYRDCKDVHRDCKDVHLGCRKLSHLGGEGTLHRDMTLPCDETLGVVGSNGKRMRRQQRLQAGGRLGWGMLVVGALLSACSSDGEDPGLDPCSSSGFTEFLYNPGTDSQTLAGLCMSRSLTPDAQGQVGCVLLEGRMVDQCDCSQAGRQPVAPEHASLVEELQDGPVEANCFCEIRQLLGDELIACQNDTSQPLMSQGAPVNGWCAIDSTTIPPTGNPELTAACPEVERRFMRMAGEALEEPSALMVACQSGDICSDG